MLSRFDNSKLLWSCGGFLFLVALASQTTVHGDDVNATTRAGDGRLESALAAESAGKMVDRRSLLAALGGELPRAARWQTGEVFQDGRWVPVDSLPSPNSSSDAWSEYLKERGAAQLDAEGHRRLARWCRERALAAQEQAHWYGVLLSLPNDAQARNALGHQWLGDRWYSATQLKMADAESKRLIGAWETWMPPVRRLVLQLQSNEARHQAAALKELKSLTDPAVVPSLEIACLQVDDQIAMPMLKAIESFRTEDACLALARIALSFTGQPRGDAAMLALKNYPLESYAPDMLAILSSPLTVDVGLAEGRNGSLLMTQTLFRETQDRKQMHRINSLVAVDQKSPRFLGQLVFSVARKSVKLIPGGLQTPFPSSRVAVLTRNNPLSKRAAVRELQDVSQSLNHAVSEQNLQNAEVCEAVHHVLSSVTGDSIEPTPRGLWNWWTHYNERYSNGRKPLETSEYSTVLRRLTVEQPYIMVSQQSRLVQGTAVQTSEGLKAIETIRIGDLVLSQDAESGELALKPVLQTTVRPPNSTSKIVTDAGVIQATGGHRWWAPGKGWVRTRDLKAGMTLHNATGTTLINDVVEDLKEQETYNLVVEGFHTYFVGRDRVLSYDNTDVKPTLRSVPGFGALAKN